MSKYSCGTRNISDLQYVLEFALEILEEKDLLDESSEDNWIIGKSIEKELKKLNTNTDC